MSAIGAPTEAATDIADRDPYSALFELWQLSSKKRRATTIEEYGRVFNTFAQSVCNKALADLSRRDVVAFRDALLTQGQSTTTTNHKIGILKTIFRTAVDYELVAVNPAVDVRTQTTAGPKPRVAFTADDLNRLFQSEIYTEGKRPVGGGRDAAYWLPLLALYTGARVEELAQLMVGDVRYADGQGHYLYISDEAKHAKLKNASSKRRIPVHPLLDACGFVDYAQRQKASGLLFPHLKPNPRSKLGGYFSSFFSHYLRHTVGITDARKVFHSFRHTFKDACRAVGIEEAVHDALTGHTTAAASRKYGNDLYPLAPLFEAIEEYEIAELDLSHLFTRPYTPRASRTEMKLVCAFYGVVIAFAPPRKKEVAPFVIAQWQGHEAAIDVASNRVLYGQLPAHKLMLVNAWIEIRREEIVASWHAGRVTGEYFRLAPLR